MPFTVCTISISMAGVVVLAFCGFAAAFGFVLVAVFLTRDAVVLADLADDFLEEVEGDLVLLTLAKDPLVEVFGLALVLLLVVVLPVVVRFFAAALFVAVRFRALTFANPALVLPSRTFADRIPNLAVDALEVLLAVAVFVPSEEAAVFLL